LVGLYLAAPFLRCISTHCRPADRIVLIVGGFVVFGIEALVESVRNSSHISTFLTTFIPFIPYLFAGRRLFERPRAGYPAWRLAAAGFCGVLIALGLWTLIPKIGLDKALVTMYGYLNPLTAAAAWCIFQSFVHREPKSEKLRAWVARCASVSLGIYMVHPFWLYWLNRVGLDGGWIHPLLGIPATTAAAFLLSAASSELMAKVPGLKSVVT